MHKQLFTNAIPVKGELQLSELRYRRLFEAAQDGILILDADTGQITDANPFVKEILGYAQSELLGKELWEIGAFKDILDSKIAFRQLQTQGYIRYKDLPLQTKDGDNIDVEFVSNVYMVDKQKMIQCNIRDTTDRTKIERLAKSRAEELESLSRSQEQTKRAMLNVMEDLESARTLIEIEKAKDEAMLASIGDGLIAVDTERRMTVVNNAAAHTLGYKTHELVGKKITTLRLEDEKGALIPPHERPSAIAFDTGQVTNTNYFYVGKDKKRIPLAINVTPITLNEKTIGAVVIFRDITREKEIDRSKNEFVSLASHQLRTPLGIAKWYIEAIKKEGYFDKVPEVAKEYLDEVYKSNERLLSLVRDLLSISRIDQGKIRNNPEMVNITELIKNVIKGMTLTAKKNSATIHLIIKKSKTISIFIDPLRMQEVIENLITNAITYSKSGGMVEVVLDSKDDKILVAVKDTGIGMSKEDKKKIFSKFFRSETAKMKNAEGSGLGLYVVKSYIEGWGGDISVDSSKGKGSTFAISVPMQQGV